MSDDNQPVHLFFNRQLASEYLSESAKQTLINDLERRVIPSDNWNDLSEKLKLRPKSICFYHSELEHTSAINIVNMVGTLSKLVGLDYQITITVSIDKTTPYKLVKELQKSNILGIIPSYKDFGFEETLKGIRAQWAELPYWPKHILEQLPGYKLKTSDAKSSEIKLTTRQHQILDIINTRGASNKIIARMLNISESTVKLHVSAILRKYNVRNRTQLALFSKKGN